MCGSPGKEKFLLLVSMSHHLLRLVWLLYIVGRSKIGILGCIVVHVSLLLLLFGTVGRIARLFFAFVSFVAYIRLMGQFLVGSVLLLFQVAFVVVKTKNHQAIYQHTRNTKLLDDEKETDERKRRLDGEVDHVKGILLAFRSTSLGRLEAILISALGHRKTFFFQ